ncbi:hypothetical protein F5Y07DRAFT_71211 [Xylaria sp. FL0933]|nr:hypothetical protein F5Y07DRAFT_71211 [Xylaria sp. FL0933]
MPVLTRLTMSYPVDNDINPGSINNHTHHPYAFTHPPHPQHGLSQHGQHSQQQQQQQQQQEAQYFGLVSPFNGGNNPHTNPHHQHSAFSGIPAYSQSSFNLGGPPYSTIPQDTLVAQEQDTSPTSGTDLPHKLSWNSKPETSSHQHAGLPAGAASYQPDMRYIKGPLDVLNAEQYDDGRYTNRRGIFKAESHVVSAGTATSNPKKRSRKVSQNDRVEPVEEIKRARGRPRLEAGDHKDMKERRKEQIRIAQRAYRTRKDNAITDLEAKVAGLEASNLEVSAAFQSMLMEYVDKNAINAQIPELGRRLQQFQAVLAQRCADVTTPTSDETISTPDAKSRAKTTLPDRSQSEREEDDNSRAESQVATIPATQQPQQLLGGIIVTHEPEPQTIIQDLAHVSEAPFEDGSYTFVRMPNPENASFGFNLGFLDSPMQSQWTLPHWESLAMPDSGAYSERTFGRRLHRRMTEKAAKLLAMKDPPYDAMHRVFGFVRNYASLDSIRQRIRTTLSRGADEDMDAYAQPFHHIGGAGTHFAGAAKTVAFPGGAPFQSTGFGMGPFDPKTTAVRDELLDALQHTKFPGWQGEWFDSYEVEQYLASKSISLPQDDGYVEIPPGEFYENPLLQSSSSSSSPAKSDAAAAAALHGSMSGKVVEADFGEDMAMQSTALVQNNHNSNNNNNNGSPYPSPVSSIDGMLSIPATADLWSSASPADFLALSSQSMTMAGNMSSLLAYHHHHNAVSTSLGFADSSSPFVFAPSSASPTTAMDLVSGGGGGQMRNKRVWFSVDKFIESLGAKSTCVGRGPAFRKKDIVTAFWEAARPGPG